MRHSSRPPRRVPANFRTLPVRGRGDDAGKFYRCSYCGFVCDIDRDQLEGENATAGNDTEIVVTPSDSADSLPRTVGSPELEIPFVLDEWAVIGDGSEEGAVGVLSGDLNFFHTAMKNGMDGTPLPIYHAFEPKVNFGCPFCGTTNWKG